MELILLFIVLVIINVIVDYFKPTKDNHLPDPTPHKPVSDIDDILDGLSDPFIDLPEDGPVTYTYPIGDIYMSAKIKSEYLHSQQWYDIRATVLERDKCCVICGSDEHLNCHHLHYRNLGAEDISDLVILCQPCHQRQHDHYGYDRTTDYSKLIKE